MAAADRAALPGGRRPRGERGWPRASPLARSRAPRLLLASPAGLSWAALLQRVVAVDVLHGPRGGGPRRIVAVPTRPETLRPLLARLGFVLAPPSAAPSRSPPRREE